MSSHWTKRHAVSIPNPSNGENFIDSRRAMGATQTNDFALDGVNSQQASAQAETTNITPAEANSRQTKHSANSIPKASVEANSQQSIHAALSVDASTVEAKSHSTNPVANTILASSDGTNFQQAIRPSKTKSRALAELNSHPTIPCTNTTDISSDGTNVADCQVRTDIHTENAVGTNARQDSTTIPCATTSRQSLLDPALALAADVVDDLERVRIANENRLRQLTRTEEDSDGEIRGFGLDESHPDVARLAAIVETLNTIEHQAVLNLQRHMRRHPLGSWGKKQRGVGEKQLARLLATIGDPYIRPEITKADGTVVPEGPRTVSALWAYCGLHVLPVSQTSGDNPNPTADLNQFSVDQTRPDNQCRVVDRNKFPIDQISNEFHLELVGRDQLSGNQSTRDSQMRSVDGKMGSDPDQISVENHLQNVGVAARRIRGQQANWSTKAKTRVYLIALSCLKQLDKQCRDGHFASDDKHPPSAVAVCSCSPYRIKYDQRRAHTAVTHSEWTDGHSHNDALRISAKMFLRDLWIASREYHNGDENAK